MSDSVVLNEASFPFESLEDCQNNINSFFDLLHEAKSNHVQFSRADDIEGSWNRLDYAPGFNLERWLNSIKDQDRQRQIKSVISDLKCPLIGLNPNKQGLDPDQLLFYHESNEHKEVLGLAFAYLNQSYSLSAPSKNCWIEDSISIVKEWYENNQPQKEIVCVPNLSSTEQLAVFLERLRELRQGNAEYLSSLEIKGNRDFPNLVFTENFLKSVRSCSLQIVDFKRLMAVLTNLNSAIAVSKNLEELGQNSTLTITNESDTTMNNKALAKLREFKHPTLGKTTFEPHIKNFVNGKRMHILPDYEEKKVCIGYFGHHLKT